MTVEIKKGKAQGSMWAPASKSMAHRTLICGALSQESIIKDIDFSEDIKATLSCLEALGAKVEIKGNTVRIGGILENNNEIKNPLYCNESGSTLRFLLPLCLVKGKPALLTGKKRLFERSLGVYEDICNSQGIKYKQTEEGVAVAGILKSGKYEVRGDISSQFISGLLFALPLLEGDSEITVTEKFESASYIGLTLKALEEFGIRVTRKDVNTFYIKGSQSYKGKSLSVEGDYSNAAFFEALNLFGGNVMIKGLDEKSLQGDKIYKEYFSKIINNEETFDLSDCPDLGPIMFAVAAAKGGGYFTGTGRLKIKESDRVAAMTEELRKFSVPVTSDDNSVTIGKAELTTPTEILYGHNDHRIVMALSVLCSVTGGKIKGAEAVAKSLPDFFDRLESLGIEVIK